MVLILKPGAFMSVQLFKALGGSRHVPERKGSFLYLLRLTVVMTRRPVVFGVQESNALVGVLASVVVRAMAASRWPVPVPFDTLHIRIPQSLNWRGGRS